MTTQLDVLVLENHRHAADAAIAALEAADHKVHRCFDADGPGFPCTAVRDPGSCPIDQGIDVTLVVRDRIEPRPTRYETGVSCAIRAGIPLAEVGPQELDPFAPWVNWRVVDDVVAGVAAAADRGFDRLRDGIATRIAPLVQRSGTDAAINCSFERKGRSMAVHLYGPAVGDRLEKAIAVRVLDAVWSSGRVHDQVDVHYHADDRMTA